MRTSSPLQHRVFAELLVKVNLTAAEESMRTMALKNLKRQHWQAAYQPFSLDSLHLLTADDLLL
jgi:hypothetical protein